MQHPDEGLIHAWLDGALSAEEGARIDAHVRGCASCAASVADARGLIASASRIVGALDAVPVDVIPAAPRPAAAPVQRPVWTRLRLTPARAALAATVLVAVSSLLAVRHDSHGNRRFQQPAVAQPAVMAPAPAPAAAPEAPAPRRVGADSLRARDANPATAAPLTRAAPAAVAPPAAAPAAAAPASIQRHLRISDQVTPLAEVATTGPRARCFAVRGDSAVHALPARFSLVSDGVAPTTARTVRALTADGRLDSTLTAARWDSLSATTTRVVLPSADAGGTVTLTLVSGAPTARASSAGITQDVIVRPIPCRE